MSAIYGAIDFGGNSVNPQIIDRFEKAYSDCRIDRWGSVADQNVAMGCGIQFFYKRAEREKLPRYDENDGLYYTADCVIDNRKQLIPELGLSNDAADGDIILAGYKKWGKECVSHFQGLFAFVIYDENRNEIFAAVDQFAQRCLFYHVRNGVFYFSTRLFSLAEASELTFDENEEWLVNSQAVRGPMMMLEPRETALNGVKKIVCGNYITVSLGEYKDVTVKEYRYYDPQNDIPTDWSITFEQSEQMVRDAMRKVMEQILDEQENVAAQLSSGLDSSTVACNAAQILGKRGGKVYSYTSIPSKEANLKNSRYISYDETEGVKVITDAYSNIEATFVECADRDYSTEAQDVIDMWELPCKSQQNSIWVDEIFKMVSETDCRILLDGATGNTTISAGHTENIAYYYLKNFEFRKAYHMFDPVKKAKLSRKKLFKRLLKNYLDYYRWYFDGKRRNCYKDIVLNEGVGETHNLTERLHKDYMHYFPFASMDRMRLEMYMESPCAQIGEIEVKHSLRYGVLERDPMRSVPFISMCMKLPIYCFASNDYDRRLVRVGMEGIVPEKTRTDMFARGSQSGDNLFRTIKQWPFVKERFKKSLNSPEVMHYFDQDKIDRLIEEAENGIDKMNMQELLMINDLYSFCLFMEKIGRFTNKK